MPPSPDWHRWPISLPRFFEMPRRIISSSVQKVPSTITTSLLLMACQTVSSISARPGA